MKYKIGFLFFSLGLTVSLFSESPKTWLKYKYPFVTAENALWIGTPQGLYQYHYEEDSWAIYGSHNGLPSNDIQILRWDDEYLWIATPGGLAYGDIKLNKWIVYDTSNGLPSNTIHSIAFQEDYVWIATDKGAARYDKLIQEWELFSSEDGLPSPIVYDIAVEGDYVYFATDSGLTEYEINFEKWRYYGKKEGIASDTIRFIYQTTDFLWLFTDKGPSRFNKKLHLSQSFEDSRLYHNQIRDLIISGETFWLATDSGLLTYDPANNLWRPFLEASSLPDPVVKTLTMSQDRSWFVTEGGVTVQDQKTKSWRRWNLTHGLSSEDYDTVLEFLGRIFLVNDNSIDYYKSNENHWTIYPLRDIGSTVVHDGLSYSLDREQGSHIRFSEDVKLSLSGSRFTFRHLGSLEYDLFSENQTSTFENAQKGDWKAQFSLPRGRTVNGFYNNTDFSQTLYGVRYKGIKGDIVQEVNWGDVRHEQGKQGIIQSIGIFGGSARLEAGPKTERYKRSRFSAKGISGEKTSGFETEFFTGNFKHGASTVLDNQYIRNTFYTFERLIDSPGYEFQDTYQFFRDDRNPFNNTRNTFEDTIGSHRIVFFDKLESVLDYQIDIKAGILQLNQGIQDTAILYMRINSPESSKTLSGLQDPGYHDHSLSNRYHVGGRQIVPHTFQMEITDLFGTSLSLADFGIDRDRNGQVDPDWIDYENGILHFPDRYPFPDRVYSKEKPDTNFVMTFRFESEINILNLRQRHLIRGSEQVTIDGELLTAGEDYVLDYTSGTLLIIKEGILAEDSEIEITYEYYRDSDEQFQMAGLSYGPSDHVLIEANVFAFDPENAREGDVGVTGVQSFSEFKWKLKGLDLKVTPEFARSTHGENSGNSANIRLDMSSARLRLFTQVEKYEATFTPLYEKKFKLGKLNERLMAGMTVYPLSFVDISTLYKNQKAQLNPDGSFPTEETITGKILFSKRRLPAISVTGRQQSFEQTKEQVTKQSVKGNFEYQIPADILKSLSLNSVRVYGVWRRSWEDRQDEQLWETGLHNRYDNQYLRMDFSPADLVQINAYYRGRSQHSDEGLQHLEKRLRSRRQKYFLDATVDRLTGLNMNLRYQNEMLSFYPAGDISRINMTVVRTLQTSLRLFPGRWFAFMQPFTFEINLQPTWRGSMRNRTETLSPASVLGFSEISGPVAALDAGRMTQLRGEWRPTASFLFYSSIDFFENRTTRSNSELLTDTRRMNHRAEIRPGMHTLITVQYQSSREEKGSISTWKRDNPMLWFENRWGEKFFTRLNLTWWREVRIIGHIEEKTSSLAPLLGMTYRIPQKGSAGGTKAEIRNDFSFSAYRSRKATRNIEDNTFTNTFAIDFYPASIFILRLRWTAGYRNDLLYERDIFSNLWEARLTAQF